MNLPLGDAALIFPDRSNRLVAVFFRLDFQPEKSVHAK
jgi:hypothetical protein